MNYKLRRAEDETFIVDSDLWLGALDLAVRNGWKPRGVEDPETAAPDADRDPLRYEDGWGQRISAEDALELARGLQAALSSIPDLEVPLQGKEFGETTTRSLIERASQGQEIPPEDLPGAAEVLSGPPKTVADALAAFLAQGALTVEPT